MWLFNPRGFEVRRPGGNCVLLTRSVSSVETVTRALDRTGIRIHAAASLAAGRRLLEEANAEVVLSETVFLDGTWEDALAMTAERSGAVRFVLAMPEFDGGLWVRALNRGVYDVVVQPYDAGRLAQTLTGAFRTNTPSSRLPAEKSRARTGLGFLLARVAGRVR